jgi:hypothetical protein
MKYVICYSAFIILLIPAVIVGVITFIWTPTIKGFKQGPQWLDRQFNYGKMLENLLEF